MKELIKKLSAKVWMDGVWKHKYNPSKNLQIEQDTGIPNDRDAYDVGIEPEHYK